MKTTISINLSQAGDVALFENLAPDVFDYPIKEELLEEFLSDKRHHMVIALDGTLIVGMATAVNYIHPDKPSELWINEVGVSPDYQRKGIGRRLVQRLLDHGKSLNCREAWLATEHDNIPARRLYKAIDGKEESVVYVTFPLA